MSAARAQPAACKKHGAPPHIPRSTGFPQVQDYDIPADFAKADSILRHLQQAESQDWLGEISHCCTQVCYLLLQNYNISRWNFYNYNFYLIVFTTVVFAQRILFFLWKVTQFSDAHGLRFACHMVIFFLVLDMLYCGMQLVVNDSFVGSLYLATPLLVNVLFYHVYLKTNTNVFTAELFSMLSRCVYHSLEIAYCIGVLPLRFLQSEYVYYDTPRCFLFTAFITAHTYVMLLCLELHCLGPEVLQQARMLGEWRWVPDPKIKSMPQKIIGNWSLHECPYPRGAVVRYLGQYYEAVATLNTRTPTRYSHIISTVASVLGDAHCMKAWVLAALVVLNLALVLLILWSNQWSMYVVMLIPNYGNFFYVKYRRCHAFFNQTPLDLKQFQKEQMETPLYKPNGAMHHNANGHQYAGECSCEDEMMDEDGNHQQHQQEALANGRCDGTDLSNYLADAGAAVLQYHNPLFVSAISTSTTFFFGNACTGPAASDLEPVGLRHESPAQSER